MADDLDGLLRDARAMTVEFVRFVKDHLSTHIEQPNWVPTPQVIQAFGSANKWAIEHEKLRVELLKRFQGNIADLGDDELQKEFMGAVVHYLETATPSELAAVEKMRDVMAQARKEQAH